MLPRTTKGLLRTLSRPALNTLPFLHTRFSSYLFRLFCQLGAVCFVFVSSVLRFSQIAHGGGWRRAKSIGVDAEVTMSRESRCLVSPSASRPPFHSLRAPWLRLLRDENNHFSYPCLNIHVETFTIFLIVALPEPVSIIMRTLIHRHQ